MEEIREIVATEVTKMKEAGTKVALGPLQKALWARGGPLEGRPANGGDVSQAAKEAADAAA